MAAGLSATNQHWEVGGPAPEVIGPTDAPVYPDVSFWSSEPTRAEARARKHLTDAEIDGIFDEVTAVIDENLLRFDPLVAYYGGFFPEGDAGRIEDEREAADSVKRDLAWAAMERAIGEPAFFSNLLAWYDRGLWPVGWAGIIQRDTCGFCSWHKVADPRRRHRPMRLGCITSKQVPSGAFADLWHRQSKAVKIQA